MATSNQGEGKFLQYLEEHILECSICAEQFDDPKTLNCQHTFCKTCIEQHIARRRRSGKFECPICRTEHAVPTGGAGELAGSVVIKSIIEAASVFRNDDVKCTSCVQNLTAVVACYSCGDFLCTECKRLHDNLRVKQRHSVCPINELKHGKNLAKFQKSRYNFCDEHPGEMKKLYCNVHNVEICTMCSFEEDHKIHTQQISTLATKVNKVQEEIKNDISELKSASKKIKNGERSLIRMKLSLERNQKEDLTKIDENLQFVIKLLTDYAETMRSKISENYSSQKKSIEAKKAILSERAENIDRAIQEAAILDELPLCNVLLAATNVKDTLKLALENSGEKEVKDFGICEKYVGPPLNKVMNKSLEKMAVGYIESNTEESCRILWSNGVSENDLKTITSKIKDVCALYAKNGLSFSTYEDLCDKVRTELDTKCGRRWLCIAGTAECYATSLTKDKDEFPFVFAAWNQIYLVLFKW